MNRDQLRQWLEFYRDLGFTALYRRQPPAAVLNHPAPGPEATIASAGAAELSLDGAPPYNPPLAPSPQPSPPREAAAPGQSSIVPMLDILPSLAPEGDNLERIRADIGDCTRCRLHKGRKSIVFGDGNRQARLVFVGEGPGADEDEQGVPFVGRAGQLLTQMIDNTAAREGMSVRRSDVYICNVVKCRPPDNRTPEPDEMEICGQFLFRQLLAIHPKAICALGTTASRALLGTREGVTKLRGRWHRWRDIPVMVTYHPSYLLRPYNQGAKREAWEDLKKVLHYVYD